MASSSSGAAGPGMLDRRPSRRLTRARTMLDDEDPTADSELVPSSLASIGPILRVANEIEEENPRVAYLCMLVLICLVFSLSLFIYGHMHCP